MGPVLLGTRGVPLAPALARRPLLVEGGGVLVELRVGGFQGALGATLRTTPPGRGRARQRRVLTGRWRWRKRRQRAQGMGRRTRGRRDKGGRHRPVSPTPPLRALLTWLPSLAGADLSGSAAPLPSHACLSPCSAFPLGRGAYSAGLTACPSPSTPVSVTTGVVPTPGLVPPLSGPTPFLWALRLPASASYPSPQGGSCALLV